MLLFFSVEIASELTCVEGTGGGVFMLSGMTMEGLEVGGGVAFA